MILHRNYSSAIAVSAEPLANHNSLDFIEADLVITPALRACLSKEFQWLARENLDALAVGT